VRGGAPVQKPARRIAAINAEFAEGFTTYTRKNPSTRS